MTDIAAAGTYKLGDRAVKRMGYGAMQLAGPWRVRPAEGPRRRRGGSARGGRGAASTISTPATSTGPHVTNEIIREALHPYPDDLVIVTKGRCQAAVRTARGTLRFSSEALESAVRDNLRNLGIEAMDVVNLRLMGGGAGHGPAEGVAGGGRSRPLAELQRKGLIRHLGLSNATPKQVAEARTIAEIVCVQNLYNIANRGR